MRLNGFRLALLATLLAPPAVFAQAVGPEPTAPATPESREAASATTATRAIFFNSNWPANTIRKSQLAQR